MAANGKSGSQGSKLKRIWKSHRREKQSLDITSQLPSQDLFYADGNEEDRTTKPQFLEPLEELRESSSRSRSRDRRAEPQGLSVLHEPVETRVADIIFVHGLGGSSISTWTKDGDEETFWPQKLLPSEPELSRTRILSFGYTAFFWSKRSSRKLSIMDFARSLLACLKSEIDLGFGQVPIIFVAHSLGGLVVKKAYTLGRSSDTFRNIISSVSAMMFLGTPHHGSNLAKVLNRVLAASTIGPYPKQYVAELTKDSPMIEDLNEQFRHFLAEIQIASFYETQYTFVGLKRTMIVEKQSAVIGCPNEIPQPLDADHHQLCKFGNREDKNYIRVHKMLKSLIPSPLSRDTVRVEAGPPSNQMEKVSFLLAMAEGPKDDLNFFSDRRLPETCSWILSDPNFQHWLESPQATQAIWIHGPPGSGKSILTSFLIDHFQENDITCCYYFFRFGDQALRSVGSFLRSLALQIAEKSSTYKQYLEVLSDNGVRLEKKDARSIWQKLFATVPIGLATSSPVHVIIDGLDESDSPQTLLSLLSSISFETPLRLIAVSRSTPALSSYFDKFPDTMPVTRMSAEHTRNDIPFFVEKGLQLMHGSDSLRRRVINEIIDRASGSFLWVHLAIQEVLDCNTENEIEQALQEIPSGMQPLYERMEEAMARVLKPADQKLAKILLIWATCSRRPLTLEELAKAIEPEFYNVIDLKHTIGKVSGNFLVIDRKSHVMLVHQTAREYLTKLSTGPFTITPSQAHDEIFLRCMSCLNDPILRSHKGPLDLPALSSYAVRYWSSHLQSHSADSERILDALSRFLQSSTVLSWMKILALHDQLKTLVQSSRSLSAFAEKRRAMDASIASNIRPLQTLEYVELWAIDFIKIVGKFGQNLLDMPDSIFKFIPQICPRQSIIHRQFGQRSTFKVSVSGDSNAVWDDNLAKIFVGASFQALYIVCTNQYFAILTTANSIIVWDSSTCQRHREYFHQETISSICVSASGKMIAAYGIHCIKIWEIGNGKEFVSIPNLRGSRAFDMIFAKNDTEILAALDNGVIQGVLFRESQPDWKIVDLDLRKKEATVAGTVTNTPCCIAFSTDGEHVAIAFRGAPLSIWRVREPELISRCRRERNDRRLSSGARPWTAVYSVIWHPRSGEILGIYQDASVFKWHPLEDSSHDTSLSATVITLSSDGDLLATSDANGTVKVSKFPECTPIWQLRCEYPVSDLAFSPDNRRLYDLRGCFCHVWEPNALIRLSEFEAPGSETRSESGSTVMSTKISEAEVDIEEPISTLAVSPRGDFYTIGSSEGAVRLLHSTCQVALKLWESPSFMPIEHIVWSTDGIHVALRDLAGKIVVRELENASSVQASRALSARTVFEATIQAGDGPIEQVLLSPDSQLLLVASAASAQTWSVDSGACLAKWKAQTVNTISKWVNHPMHKEQLLRISAEQAFSCGWQDLVEISSNSFNIPDSHKQFASGNRTDRIRKPSLPRSMSSDHSHAAIENAMLTQDGAYIMIELARFLENHVGERQLMLFSKSGFGDSNSRLSSKPVPSHLLDRLQLPLGVLPGDRFVFLDNDNWLCSWRLTSTDGRTGIDRHFFLPRSWLTAECLELCTVLEDGVFVIPKDGEVAVIQSDLSLQW